MCFSPEADLVAGVTVGAIGIDALRHISRRRQVPLAALPVILAAHQLVEAFVWLGLRGEVPDLAWHPAVYLYLTIAFGVLPLLVPAAVAALEPIVSRLRVGLFTAIGAAAAVPLTYALVRGPVTASIQGHHIAYRVHLWQGGSIVALYVVATCGSMMVSKDHHVRRFGAINLIAVFLLARLYTSGFISLWCAWAAVTSIAIAVHLRHANRLSGRSPVHRGSRPKPRSIAGRERGERGESGASGARAGR